MFRRCSVVRRFVNRFPRTRGDVPAFPVAGIPDWAFSPHTRGCSSYDGKGVTAYSCFPRTRGDVPYDDDPLMLNHLFSPHTRGCSEFGGLSDHEIGVFPAHAGMFLRGHGWKKRLNRFPRTRGDVPKKSSLIPPRLEFSPHTRGCSH